MFLGPFSKSSYGAKYDVLTESRTENNVSDQAYKPELLNKESEVISSFVLQGGPMKGFDKVHASMSSS